MNANTKQSRKEKYQMVLDRFISDNQDIINYKRKPFSCLNKICATNVYEFVALPKLDEYEDMTERVSTVYPCKENTDCLIYTKALRRAVESAPKIKEPKFITIECYACDGYGSANIDVLHNGKIYDITIGCPICYETGYSSIQEDNKNGEEKYDMKFIFKIGVSYFYMERVLQLLFVAETLNKNIRLVYQADEHLQSMFKVGESDVILMPIMRSRDGGEMIEIEFNKQ